MALPETWKQLKHFKKDGNDVWGDPDKIADDLLLRLDDFRSWVGVPVHVLHGVKDGGHAKSSYHYVANGACAVDIILPDYQLTSVDLIIEASRFGFTGIGYYPHWRDFKGNVVGGLHVDTRPLKREPDGTIDYRHNRWMGVLRGSQQVYIPLTFHNLLKHSQGGNHDGINRLS